MGLTLAIVGIVLVLLTAELLWRRKAISGETGRKFVHIVAGSFIAFWPYFLSWPQIEILAAGGLVLTIIARWTGLFHVGFDVKRRGLGEVFFPVGVGFAALISNSPLVFTIAILHLSLADGFAAIVGLRYGMRRKYKVWSYLKTVVGTLTFWFISSLIVLAATFSSQQLPHWPLWPVLIWLPVAATLVENVAISGLDNVAVPLLVIVVLRAAGVS